MKNDAGETWSEIIDEIYRLTGTEPDPDWEDWFGLDPWPWPEQE